METKSFLALRTEKVIFYASNEKEDSDLLSKFLHHLKVKFLLLPVLLTA